MSFNAARLLDSLEAVCAAIDKYLDIWLCTRIIHIAEANSSLDDDSLSSLLAHKGWSFRRFKEVGMWDQLLLIKKDVVVKNVHQRGRVICLIIGNSGFHHFSDAAVATDY